MRRNAILLTGLISACAMAADPTTTLTVSATDADGDPLTYTWTKASGPDGATFANNNGTTSGNSCIATLSIAGTYTFICTVTDGRGGSTTSTTGNVEVIQNDAPVATAQSVSTNEDTDLDISLSATDSIGTVASYAFSQPAHGTLTHLGGAVVRYTPTAQYHGVDAYTCTATDSYGRVSAAPATITITVTAVNDAPVNAAVPTVTGKSTKGRVQSASTGSWTDIDGTVVSYAYQWQTAPSGGSYTAISGATSQTYTPTASDVGKFVRVQVTATDNGTPGAASASAVSAATLVKSNTSQPTVASSSSLTTATPTVNGSSLAGATITVYDGATQIGTVTVDGTGAWVWTASTPLAPGLHNLYFTAELAPNGESMDVGPVVVSVPGGGGGSSSGGGVSAGGGGGGGGGCGVGGLSGFLLALGLLPLRRRRR